MSPLDPVEPAPSSADALSELARVWRRYEGDPDGAIRAITETGCTAIGVARCSVWLLSDDRRSLRCADLYERDRGVHTSGVVLDASDFPRYFAALTSEEPIAAIARSVSGSAPATCAPTAIRSRLAW